MYYFVLYCLYKVVCRFGVYFNSKLLIIRIFSAVCECTKTGIPEKFDVDVSLVLSDGTDYCLQTYTYTQKGMPQI